MCQLLETPLIGLIAVRCVCGREGGNARSCVQALSRVHQRLRVVGRLWHKKWSPGATCRSASGCLQWCRQSAFSTESTNSGRCRCPPSRSVSSGGACPTSSLGTCSPGSSGRAPAQGRTPTSPLLRLQVLDPAPPGGWPSSSGCRPRKTVWPSVLQLPQKLEQPILWIPQSDQSQVQPFLGTFKLESPLTSVQWKSLWKWRSKISHRTLGATVALALELNWQFGPVGSVISGEKRRHFDWIGTFSVPEDFDADTLYDWRLHFFGY